VDPRFETATIPKDQYVSCPVYNQLTFWRHLFQLRPEYGAIAFRNNTYGQNVPLLGNILALSFVLIGYKYDIIPRT
jgi:hypothetical protein